MNESGIITQIDVENFVTYDSASIKPGRFLNVIIGPNGTGKSTIVCAIVIGLGGKLSIIGRAKDVGDYVKTGKEEAKIEITLKLEDRYTKICRNFDRQSSTTWQIDGKNVSHKAVDAFIKNLNIQMDNLCQFLPQEKVQEFSNLSPEHLLVETLRSASDPKMLETLAKLKELRNKHKEIEHTIQVKNNTLTQEQAKHDNLKDIVGNIKEKKKMQKTVKNLTQKKAWMLYNEKRTELMKAKQKRDDCEKDIRKLEKEMKPIAEKIKKLEDAVNKLRSQDSVQLREITAKGNKVKNLQNQVINLDEQVADTEENWRQRVDAENRRDQEIQLTQQQIEKINNDLQNLTSEIGSVDEIQKRQNDLMREIENKRRESTTLSHQSNSLRQKDDYLSREIQNQKSQMLMIENVKAKRLEVLRRRSEDAFKAVQWLERNRDKFSSNVYDPMLLNINVSNKDYAKYIENVIPQRDLIAFVCEDKEDMNRLVQYLRKEQKLVVNVLHSDPNKNVNMNPQIPLENIRQFGFENYLVSLVEAPPTIMKYLVSMYRINNIPFGTTDFIDKNYSRVPKEISVFFSASNRYGVSVSKYSGAKSTSCDTISSHNILNITIEADLVNNIKQKLASLEQQKQSIVNDIRSLNERIDECNRATNELRDTKNSLAKNVTALNNLDSKLKRMQSKLTDLENEKRSIDELNDMFKKNIADILCRSMDVYREINRMLEDIYNCSVVNEIGRLSLKIQQRKLANEKSDSDDLRGRLDMARRTYKQLDGDLKPLRNDAEKLLKEAKETTDDLTPSDPGFKELETAFNKLPPSLPEIEKDLSDIKSRLFCMGRDGNDGEHILESYDKTVKIIEETKALLQKKGEEKAKYAQKMTEMRDKWFPEVQELVDSINVNFSRYFSELKCSGELSLVHDANIYEFDKYGLKIMVKFRDTDELQELTRTHQSGGERALTTAVYMIALQNLSRVPFRCVDEINQGMDPINERRVFQLLVKITGTSNGSQYFFLSPKLLPGLQYPKNVTVHVVYNGPYVIPHTEFSISDYAKNIKQILADEED